MIGLFTIFTGHFTDLIAMDSLCNFRQRNRFRFRLRASCLGLDPCRAWTFSITGVGGDEVLGLQLLADREGLRLLHRPRTRNALTRMASPRQRLDPCHATRRSALDGLLHSRSPLFFIFWVPAILHSQNIVPKETSSSPFSPKCIPIASAPGRKKPSLSEQSSSFFPPS
jgi:hypothetical protein